MGVRNLDAASKSLKQLIDEGIVASLVQVDVSDLNSVHNFLKSNTGQIDILINNAAISRSCTEFTFG